MIGPPRTIVTDLLYANPTAFQNTGTGQLLIGVMVTFIGGIMVLMITRMFRRIDRQDAALTELSRGLALTIDQIGNARPTIDDHGKRVSTLEGETAVLRDRLDRHEHWSTGQAALLDEIRSRPRPNST
jgi:uncharacterized membrane protein YhiD involved in acid resistance